MGDFIGIAIFMTFWAVIAGLASALSRWAYKKVSDGRTMEQDSFEESVENESRKLGLASAGLRDFTRPGLAAFEGERGGYFVRIDYPNRVGPPLRVTLEPRGTGGPGIADELGIAPREPDRQAGREGGSGGSPTTGDAEFDRKFRLSGDPALVAALMDQLTRWTVSTHTSSGHLRLERGRLVAEFDDRLDHSEIVESRIGGLLRLAGRLAFPAGDLEKRLAHNALQDPDPSVRMRVLDVLGSRAAAHPEARATLRSALQDANPQIRFHAAAALGDEGLPVLEELVYLPGPHEEVAVQALERLSRHATPGRFLLLLKSALAGPDGPRRLAALRGLERLGVRMTEQEALAILDSELPEVCRASLAALAEVGTAAAVAPLHALLATRPLELPLRAAVQQAIAEIQGRLIGAAAGQVNLAPGEDVAGRVSLAPEQRAGRVALSPRSETSRKQRAGG